MRFIRVFTTFFLIFSVFTLLGVLLYVTDEQADVNSFVHITKEDIQKAKDIVAQQQNSDTIGGVIELTERDVNIAVNHLLNRHVDSATQIETSENTLKVASSINLSLLPGNRFINIRFKLTEIAGQVRMQALQIGDLEISNALSEALFRYMSQQSDLSGYFDFIANDLSEITIDKNLIKAHYKSNKSTVTKLRSLVAYPADNETLRVYQQRLAEVIEQHDRGWLLSLADLLQPLFELAYQRSTLDTAITENRHVIFVVSAYVNKQQWQNFLPEKIPGLTPKLLPVYIYKRTDMAQHFIASAAVTSLGSSYLANLIGLKKEIRDSGSGGSGFSFIDLAADRAGMYFGKTATSSARNARKMQFLMSGIEDYRAFMPDVRDLPDQINQAKLIEQYRSVDSAASQAILKKIDGRIKNSPIYQTF